MAVNTVEKQGNKATGKSTLMKRLRRILIFAAVVVAIGASVFFWWMSRDLDGSDNDSGTYTVRRDNLPITVTENGAIKAINSKEIKSEVEGRTTIISIVDEGTIITPEDVNNGKVLVKLDSSDIEQKLTQQEVQFLSAEASYTDANESLDIQKKQNDSDIKAGQLTVRFTLMDLQKYLGDVVAEKLMPAPPLPSAPAPASPDASRGSGTADKGVTQHRKASCGAQVSPATNPGPEPNEIASAIEAPALGGEALQKLREMDNNITLAESNFENKSDELMWTEKLYKKQDYNIVVPLELLRQAARTRRIFSIVLGSIAAISLLVGGIGIMNIMLATVSERTREIGIRRALGARKRDIIIQFLSETLLLTWVGGVLGIILGSLIPALVTYFGHMPTIITGSSLVLAFGISAAVGITFGLYPAYRAANMDPIESLRHE